jgi:hypothetical protein
LSGFLAAFLAIVPFGVLSAKGHCDSNVSFLPDFELPCNNHVTIGYNNDPIARQVVGLTQNYFIIMQ